MLPRFRSHLSSLLLLLGLLSLLAFKGHTTEYPQDYFRSPLGIPILLSGNFAEMRSNHFHSGLDIKTNNTTGYRIYAAADGWVSRIKVSPVGYGLALYIDHPNGYTTVYGHLDRYNPEISAYVKRLQYRQKHFELDTYPDKQAVPVKKGDIIAFSGNSGSSGGPHLHFEIRNAATEWPINPWLFGLEISDTTPPRIYRMKVYALDEGSMAILEPAAGGASLKATPGAPATVEVESTGAAYRLRGIQALRAQGRIGFGLQTHDYMNGSQNRLGVYRIRLEADAETLYRSEMETFSFDVSRYLNAHVDYAEHEKSSRWFQRSYLLPGNRLPLYQTRDAGTLRPVAGQTHNLHYFVEDVKGNHAELRFTVKGMEAPLPVEAVAKTGTTRIPRSRSSTFQREGLTARFDANTFYEDLDLRFAVSPPENGAFSPMFTLHDTFTPVHSPYSLSLLADRLPARLQDKALIGHKDDKGRVSAAGGTYRNGHVTARLRTLGTFFVIVDTTAPKITPVNIREGQDLRQAASMQVKIEDDLSGIASYNGTVDGEWVLFAYDPKRKMLAYDFDENVPPGNHRLELVVTDQMGNRTAYAARFRR